MEEVVVGDIVQFGRHKYKVVGLSETGAYLKPSNPSREIVFVKFVEGRGYHVVQ